LVNQKEHMRSLLTLIALVVLGAFVAGCGTAEEKQDPATANPTDQQNQTNNMQGDGRGGKGMPQPSVD